MIKPPYKGCVDRKDNCHKGCINYLEYGYNKYIEQENRHRHNVDAEYFIQSASKKNRRKSCL